MFVLRVQRFFWQSFSLYFDETDETVETLTRPKSCYKMQSDSDTSSSSSDEDDCRNVVRDRIIADIKKRAMEPNSDGPSEKRTRPGHAIPVVRGSINDSTWAVWLRNNHDGLQDPTSPASVLFRERFRVTYTIYLRTVDLATDWFPQADFDVVGRSTCPVSLKVLGVFRVLGRAYCFDSVGELCNTDAEIHRVFFHKFVKKFATELQDQWIRMPTGDELARVMRMYGQRGQPGAIGSMDGWQMFLVTARALRRAAKGKDSSFPNRGYNMISSPNRRVFSLNGGHLGNVNDKTKVLYHDDVMNLETVYANVFFDMYTSVDNDVKARFYLPYLICDAGYHRWLVRAVTS
jgi:hypothetical protein